MLDIKEIYQEFQKLNKTDNCIVIVLKNETKLAITSPVSLWGWGIMKARPCNIQRFFAAVKMKISAENVLIQVFFY